MTDKASAEANAARRAYFVVAIILQLIMAAELVALLASGRWMHAFLVGAMLLALLVPIVIRRGGPAMVPAELQILVALFIFATLFLGEVRDYYERIWWWDLALHGSAGVLLGVLGLLVVYVLNEDEAVDVHMRPSFLAMFAFFFAVGVGGLWEIFEYAMDVSFGLNMQKPMLGDPSGLTDTMWDLILDTAGAGVVSVAGWFYLSRPNRPHRNGPLRRFIDRNPQLFERRVN